MNIKYNTMSSKHHATERHIENELMDSLIIVNETLDRIEKDRKEYCLWRKDDYKNYQEIFTNSTMEYLLQNKPNNKFINVLGDKLVTRYWANFKLDGLIYDN
jgi:ATP/maltotriose-dependent transcriptional regulator MalT